MVSLVFRGGSILPPVNFSNCDPLLVFLEKVGAEFVPGVLRVNHRNTSTRQAKRISGGAVRNIKSLNGSLSLRLF